MLWFELFRSTAPKHMNSLPPQTTELTLPSLPSTLFCSQLILPAETCSETESSLHGAVDAHNSHLLNRNFSCHAAPLISGRSCQPHACNLFNTGTASTGHQYLSLLQPRWHLRPLPGFRSLLKRCTGLTLSGLVCWGNWRAPALLQWGRVRKGRGP